MSVPVSPQNFTPLKSTRKRSKVKTVIAVVLFFILGMLVAGTAFAYWYVQNINPLYRSGYSGSHNPEDVTIGKPVIYLYPEKTSRINVKLNLKVSLIASYPSYRPGGWSVVAEPDGTLHGEGNRIYSYLFWEGQTNDADFDLSKGFVVEGRNTLTFLQNILPQIGLTPGEYNEFITYWYPKMQNNTFNLIHFAGKDYTDLAGLDITPQPASVLRVFMVYKKLDSPVPVQPQSFIPFVRKGFTVVEWGGSELK